MSLLNQASTAIFGNPVDPAHEPDTAGVAALFGLVPGKFETLADLKAADVSNAGEYSVLGTSAVNDGGYSRYVWIDNSTVTVDTAQNTVVAHNTKAGRFLLLARGLAPADQPVNVLVMGQSNAIGADPVPDTAEFDAHPNVQVWNGLIFTTPTVSTAPFNASGSNNATLHMCNRIAEETGRQVRLVIVAQGSTSIDAWTVGGKAKYVELQAAATGAAITGGFDAFVWCQGEADGTSKTKETYQAAFSGLIDEMTGDGYLRDDSKVIVSQIYTGGLDGSGDGASANAVNSNAFIHHLLTIGDPRIRVASTAGLPVADGEVESGTAGVHFKDASLTILGRERYFGAWQMPLMQYGIDFGLERQRLPKGHIGAVKPTVETVAVAATRAVTTDEMSGGFFVLSDTSTLTLPDLTKTDYSSAVRSDVGHCVEFQVTGSTGATATIAIESGGTGVLATVGSGTTTPTIAAPGGNHLYLARWAGARWDIFRTTS